MIKTVGDLRKAIDGVDDDMRVLLRVENEDDGTQMMCAPSKAKPDAGCSELEAFLIDGTDGECHHGRSGFGCLECKAEHDRGEL